MSSNPLAVQLYSVREQLKQDRRGTLARMAEIGYGAVEPCNILDDPAGVRAELDEFGLRVCAVHAAALGDEQAELFAAAKVLGADTVIVPSAPRDAFATAEGVAGIAERLNAAAAKAAAAGLRVGYHNHAFEFENVFDGRPAWELLADSLAPEVVLEVDTYWVAVGGADVLDLMRRRADRVKFLHIKDGPMNHEAANVAVGSGQMPIDDIIAASPADWHIVEFDRSDGDVVQGVADSYQYLAGGRK